MSVFYLPVLNTGFIKGVKLIGGFITDSLVLIIEQVKSYTENTLGIIVINDISHFIIQLMHNVKYIELIKTY